MYNKILYSYIISYSIIQLLFVYLINLPSFITGADRLVYEYYYINGIYNYFFDFFVVGIYLIIANYIINLLNIKKYKVIYVILTTILISTLFMIYFISYKKSNLFFSRWFHNAKFYAVIYDVIIVTSIYLLYIILNKSF